MNYGLMEQNTYADLQAQTYGSLGTALAQKLQGGILIDMIYDISSVHSQHESIELNLPYTISPGAVIHKSIGLTLVYRLSRSRKKYQNKLQLIKKYTSYIEM